MQTTIEPDAENRAPHIVIDSEVYWRSSQVEPISLHWHDASHFHVRAVGDGVVVEPVSLRLLHGEAALA